MKTRCQLRAWEPPYYIICTLIAAALLAACTTAPAPTPCPEVSPLECPEVKTTDPPAVDCPDCLECPECPQPEPAALQAPYYQELWEASAHAEAVPCQTCHNEETSTPGNILLASEIEIQAPGGEIACISCHMGTTSSTTIDEAIAAAGLTDDDTQDVALEFIGNQNYPAGANFGGWAMGGYQYPGKTYDVRYAHVADYDSCADCHDPHTLETKLDGCGDCHQGVDSPDDFERIRGEISRLDYDGDRNSQEGIQREIEGLQEDLLEAMQAYTLAYGPAIVYDPETEPFFLIDVDGTGELDEYEADESNRYNAWTARLLKAAYNYHFSMQDPGAFLHNGKYVIQLLYDSIEDLDPGAVEKLIRNDRGHFDGSGAAWRLWDKAGEVPRDCARCHSASGLPTFLSLALDYPQPISNGMACATCHTNLRRYQRHAVVEVKFPSEVSLSIDSDSNLCLNCHRGGYASVLLEELLAEMEPDTVSADLSFPDVHHYPAGATLFGAEAGGAYQYSGRNYAGRNPHVFEFSTCVNCHNGHGMFPDEEQCATCHGQRASDERTKPIHHPSPMACRDCHGMVAVENIRGHKDYTIPQDHDGDGDLLEGLLGEITTLEEGLFTAIQIYAVETSGGALAYDSHTYPYYYQDLNGNGAADPEEINEENGYTNWTPRLLRAVYNYHYSRMDPGAYAHNGAYILQVLIDSITDVGGDTAGMRRP
jgi:hypothetical protein